MEQEKSRQTTSPTSGNGWNWDDLENFRKLTDADKDEIVRQALARLTPRQRARIEKALARQAKKYEKALAPLYARKLINK